jgi:hypothetical protein
MKYLITVLAGMTVLFGCNKPFHTPPALEQSLMCLSLIDGTSDRSDSLYLIKLDAKLAEFDDFVWYSELQREQGINAALKELKLRVKYFQSIDTTQNPCINPILGANRGVVTRRAEFLLSISRRYWARELRTRKKSQSRQPTIEAIDYDDGTTITLYDPAFMSEELSPDTIAMMFNSTLMKLGFERLNIMINKNLPLETYEIAPDSLAYLGEFKNGL